MKHDAKMILWATAACFLAGCASLSLPSNAIKGRWHFSHIRKGPSLFGQFPPPPRFDSYTFIPPDKIRLQSSPSNMDFEGTYRLAEDRLIYEFHPPDVSQPIQHDVGYAVVDRGATLILTFDQTDLVFYRPSRFLPNTIAGSWVLEVEGEKGTMRLGQDGSYRLDPGSIVGHYRLWPSRFGTIMTVVADIPSHGGHLMLWSYERHDDRLELTPITWEGPQKEEGTIWLQTGF